MSRVVVIGGGFAGLGAALELAEQGVEVELFEAQPLLGGCASTFTRKGCHFEAGATLFAGLGRGQLLRRIIERYELDLELEFPDPVLSFRTPEWRVDIPRDRRLFERRLLALDGAPRTGVHRFLALQKRVADAFWPLLERPELLPPLSRHSLTAAFKAGLGGLRSTPLLGRPLGRVLEQLELTSFEPLMTIVDGLCQITVQTSASEAEALFALAAIDYPFRDAGHVRGGIGRLADAIATAIERLGGRVHRGERVVAIEKAGHQWMVATEKRDARAQAVIATVLPRDLSTLVGGEHSMSNKVRQLSTALESGWSAAMVYVVCDSARLGDHDGSHFELVQNPREPLVMGNHLFCSGATQELGSVLKQRGFTVSTHLPAAYFVDAVARSGRMDLREVHEKMILGIEGLAPEIWRARVEHFTAGPSTFERFTGRSGGLVGGIPRRAGLRNYRSMWPIEAAPRLFLAGDSVFPGQSVLAVTSGGTCVARAVEARLAERAS